MKRASRSMGGRLILMQALVCVVAAPVMAAEWNAVGARYQAMGGSGVAAVNDAFASYWNPAALANGQSAEGDINLDAVASIEGEMVDTIDELEGIEDDIGDLLDRLDDGDVIGDEDDIEDLERVIAAIEDLEEGEGAVGTASSGLSLRWEQYAVFSRGDFQFAISSVTDTDNLNIPDVGESYDDIEDSLEDNDSGARVRGLMVVESGVGYGHKFEVPFSEEVTQTLQLDKIGVNNLGAISLGANLKHLYGITYNKYVRYRDADDVELDFEDKGLREESSNFGLDIGLLYEPTSWLAIGMMARNVNSPKFDASTKGDLGARTSDEYQLDAQVRGGIAIYPLGENRSLVLASDLDLTENESELLDGFESRLWTFGAEYVLPIPSVQLALRGGGYVNMASEAENALVLTGGLGLRAWLLSLDLAGGASPKTVDVGDGNEYPSRLNFSAVLAVKGNF